MTQPTPLEMSNHRAIRHLPEWARDIVRTVARIRGVHPFELMSRSRIRKVMLARHEAMYRIKKAKPVLSSSQIGCWFHRDHTTVLSALARYQAANDNRR